MTDPDIAAVAKGLTKAQREVVMQAEQDGGLGFYFIRWWQAEASTFKALRKREIGTAVWSGLVLSPTGLRVRAHLQQQGAEA